MAPPVVSAAAPGIGTSLVLAHSFDGQVSQPGDDGQIDDSCNSVLHNCYLPSNVIGRISYMLQNWWERAAGCRGLLWSRSVGICMCCPESGCRGAKSLHTNPGGGGDRRFCPDYGTPRARPRDAPWHLAQPPAPPHRGPVLRPAAPGCSPLPAPFPPPQPGQVPPTMHQMISRSRLAAHSLNRGQPFLWLRGSTGLLPRPAAFAAAAYAPAEPPGFSCRFGP
jgi:hypothetical protein